MHDLHESVPAPVAVDGTGPYNVNWTRLNSEWHAIAFHEVADPHHFGMPGVWTYGFGEGWAHIYADSVAINHNAIGTRLRDVRQRTAETVERALDPERNRYTGRPSPSPTGTGTVPPPKKLKWSLRNNTNYMETGVLAALRYAARNAPDMLRQLLRRRAQRVGAGARDKPYAIAIPRSRPTARLAALVNLLREHGIEVSRAHARPSR
jgi:hypothetical protein